MLNSFSFFLFFIWSVALVECWVGNVRCFLGLQGLLLTEPFVFGSPPSVIHGLVLPFPKSERWVSSSTVLSHSPLTQQSPALAGYTGFYPLLLIQPEPPSFRLRLPLPWITEIGPRTPWGPVQSHSSPIHSSHDSQTFLLRSKSGHFVFLIKTLQ